MLMMLPPPARRNAGMAYLHITKAPVRLTSMALFQSSSESVSTVPSGVTVAATLTSVVSRPNFAIVCSTAPLRACLVGDVNLERLRTAAAGGDGARYHLRFGWIEIGNSDLSSLRGEASADRAADLATSAGDQSHPVRQPVRDRHQFAACWTKRPSKIADLGGYGFLMKLISTSPSAIFSKVRSDTSPSRPNSFSLAT